MSDPQGYDDIHDLLVRSEAPDMRFDLDGAVRQGKRVRAVRRVAVAVGGLAAVGAAAVAFGALGPSIGNDALPAGPSPSVTTTGRVSAELLDGRYAVEVIPGAGTDQPNVIFYKVDGAKRTRLAGSSAAPDVVSVGTGSGADGVMLGTAPATATGFMTATTDVKGGLTTDAAPLPGTDFQALAIRFDTAAEVDRYVTTYWLDESGSVHSGAGTILPSAAIPGAQERLFVDRENRQMGSIGSGGGSLTPLTRDPWLGTGEKSEIDGWTWRTTVLLPRGAHDVSYHWASGATPGKVTVLPLDGESVAVTGTATAPAASTGPTLDRVDYTDEAGTPQSVSAPATN
jgi:hypothetical protein